MQRSTFLFHPIIFSILIPLSPLLGQDSQQSIGKIAEELKVDKTDIGISLVDAKTGSTIASLNPDKMLNPASNIKLLTSYCAAKSLSVNYRWETSFFSATPKSGDTITGDLFIKGTGDPYMVSETLWLAAKDLLNRNIKTIAGDLVLDSSDFIPFFDEESIENFENDFDRSFTAYPSALSLNFNSVTIYVRAETPREPPKVTLDPDIDYFVLENKATTIADRKRENPKIAIEKLNDRTKIKIYGTWSPYSKKVHYRKVFHPEIYFGKAFIKFYKEQGGSVSGKIRLGKAPVDGIKLMSFESRPLSHAIWGLNKFSNNFMAVQLMLTLGAKEQGYPATQEKGLSLLNKCFDSLGLRKEGNLIVSPSGLSRKTRISASQLASILIIGLSDFQVGPEFTSSLGIYGDDGTVRKRDLLKEYSGLIRVKTGSLEDVDSIAGYIKTKKGNLLAFAIIENGFREKDSSRYREFQDRLIQHIFENL
jgi:serine-type D-Ala-D-Ala carboxypeptidase/endopeptidase (penicillin-binding protein 4)